MKGTSIWCIVLIHFVPFFLMSTLCESKPRVGVKIIGTTMKPDFHRNEGELAARCPDSHPWAFSNGTLCCLNFHRSGSVKTDLDWYDAENLCPNGNHVPCPSAPCRSNEAFEDPLSCPQDHPIQMENACCWSYRRKADSNCDGDLIQKDDPASCCPDEKLFQPLDCQQFKRKCISLSPENVHTYCPLQPQTRRFSKADFSYISHIRNNIPFKNVPNYCNLQGGVTMPITNGSLNDALKLLRGPELEIPPQAFRTYLVGGVKRGYTTKCFSKSACIGKIKNKLDSVPLDFNDGFADQVNEFQLTTTGGLGIALVIRLDPPHIKLKNVRLDMHSGSYLCQIKCLD
ncbi:uncharacterized protein LOC131886540 [Tigriopus californicus]|uniref:uncharacterized protein LOC131886540 n=1 Tax=Tigriopus californicus TaxID=6832 RepID=UPI0027D9D8CC|nr:uncharacterized protein LOC131886540 [Tigriopus californicus]